jgi:hypothetical protein
MTHAKEPWVIADDGTIESRDSGLVGHLSNATEESRRRIVACVNACAGISTESLEGEGNAVVGWNRTAQKLIEATKQRDELAEHLERLLWYFDKGNGEVRRANELKRHRNGRTDVDASSAAVEYNEVLDSTLDEARAAVSSVKGQP